MCGIAGKFNYGNGRVVSMDLIRRMCSKIIHRGPDSEGYYVKENIGIGMRRLSIIDVQGGRQPIANENKDIFVICNGEIYNFQQLRKFLISRGHRFSTHSDTETIVHLYEEYGLGFMKHMMGMFAFAVWDERERRLVIGRDRMGEKPLYYTVFGGSLLFASEVKSLLEDETVERRVDLKALDLFLTYQYVPGTDTMFKGIKRLPPGTQMVIEKDKMRMDRYWKLDNRCGEVKSEEEYVESLGEFLNESIKMRLISDVPLGAFLSGGLDSSVVVALMAMNSGEPVKTYTIGFEEEDLDERKYSRIVAERFGTDHHEYIVATEARDLIEKLVWHYDQPFGDVSAVPTYLVSRITRESVTVALSGDGGDELFDGYSKYGIVNRKLGNPKTLQHLKRLCYALLERSGATQIESPKSLKGMLLSIESLLMSAEDRDFYYISLFKEGLKEKLLSEEVKQALSSEKGAKAFYQEVLRASPNGNVLPRINFMDLMHYLPGCMLTKVDVASMANSLEVRSPFLDHKVVELAVSLPDRMKIRGMEGKYILKQFAKRYLPKVIVARSKKGFAPPVDLWFRRELRDLVEDSLIGGGINDRFFNRTVVRNIYKLHLEEKENYGRLLWALLNFVLWHRTFIEN